MKILALIMLVFGFATFANAKNAAEYEVLSRQGSVYELATMCGQGTASARIFKVSNEAVGVELTFTGQLRQTPSPSLRLGEHGEFVVTDSLGGIVRVLFDKTRTMVLYRAKGSTEFAELPTTGISLNFTQPGTFALTIPTAVLGLNLPDDTWGLNVEFESATKGWWSINRCVSYMAPASMTLFEDEDALSDIQIQEHPLFSDGKRVRFLATITSVQHTAQGAKGTMQSISFPSGIAFECYPGVDMAGDYVVSGVLATINGQRTIQQVQIEATLKSDLPGPPKTLPTVKAVAMKTADVGGMLLLNSPGPSTNGLNNMGLYVQVTGRADTMTTSIDDGSGALKYRSTSPIVSGVMTLRGTVLLENGKPLLSVLEVIN